MTVREVARLTQMDPWFLYQISEITLDQMQISATTPDAMPAEQLRRAQAPRPHRRAPRRRAGVPPRQRRHRAGARVCAEQHGIRPVFKLVDTCAAEFEASRPISTPPTTKKTKPRRHDKPQSHHPRQRSQPHRAGNRVRLLLLPRRLRPSRRRLRDHHGQLQPRDRLHRLRHQRPPLLRAAHPRRRPRRLRPRGQSGGAKSA